jgi:N6-adenosine-specific RNA methylase IME4
MSLPAGPLDLIYADPPLHFTTWSDKGQGRSPSRHYATMSAPALRALPVAKLAAPDSVLALWVYGPRLPDALALIAAWGFVYKSVGLVWVKTTRQGTVHFGTGYYTR